jgi:hypothetical protein
MMDLATALIAAVTAEAAAIGAIWIALNAKVNSAEKACAEDREVLRAIVRQVSQLDRRHDLPAA